MEPAAFIPAPINTIGGGIEPMGSIEKLSKKTRSIKRCPSNETNKTIKNKFKITLTTGVCPPACGSI